MITMIICYCLKKIDPMFMMKDKLKLISTNNYLIIYQKNYKMEVLKNKTKRENIYTI